MNVAADCIVAGPCCTPQLRGELSQLSFQTLRSGSEETYDFWRLSEEIVEMLEKQVSRDCLNCGESVIN